MYGNLTYTSMKDMLKKVFADILSSEYNTVLTNKEEMEETKDKSLVKGVFMEVSEILQINKIRLCNVSNANLLSILPKTFLVLGMMLMLLLNRTRYI